MAGQRLEDALEKYRKLYRAADRKGKSRLLSDFCELALVCQIVPEFH